jgi:sigma-B regulation protein RsbU (phosphoserine phosphatase)
LFRHYEYYLSVTHHGRLLAFALVRSRDEDTGLLQHELNFVQTLVSQIVTAQQNKKLLKDKLEKERLRRELDLGRQVQYMLIPEQSITDEQVEIQAWYQPHDSIGGDYFDFARINEQEIMWCIADVSGKGISAALLMANLQAGLRAWFAITSDPLQIIRRLNDFIWKNTRGDRYITLFLGVYQTVTGELKYVNAGHQPPMLFQGANCRMLKKGTVMLGAFEDLPFLEMGNEYLASDNLIFNYTDGLIERKKITEHFCEAQVVEFLQSRTKLPLHELHESLLKYIRKAIKVKAPADDLTLLSVRIK